MKPKKTKLLAAILLGILTTAVNTHARLGDVIPGRFQVETRGGDHPYKVITIEWGNLEAGHIYEVQESTDLKTWKKGTTGTGAFLFQDLNADGKLSGEWYPGEEGAPIKFIRLIDAQ